MKDLIIIKKFDAILEDSTYTRTYARRLLHCEAPILMVCHIVKYKIAYLPSVLLGLGFIWIFPFIPMPHICKRKAGGSYFHDSSQVIREYRTHLHYLVSPIRDNE